MLKQPSMARALLVSGGVGVIWLVLAWRNPSLTYHFAPLSVCEWVIPALFVTRRFAGFVPLAEICPFRVRDGLFRRASSSRT